MEERNEIKTYFQKKEITNKTLEDFAKRLKDINTFRIIVSDISEIDLAYNKGFNDHYTIMNDKIDALVNEFKQSIY